MKIIICLKKLLITKLIQKSVIYGYIKDKYQNEMIYSKGSMRNSGKNSLSPKNKKVTVS